MNPEDKNTIQEPAKKFELFNYWVINGFNGFDLFTVRLETGVFAYVNALQIIICNFEFRFYIPKPTTKDKTDGGEEEK